MRGCMKHAVLVILALLPACTQAKPSAAAHPALWLAYDADTKVYLFGSIHLLPKGVEWTTPKLAQALNASQSLMLEVVVGKDPAKLAQVMQQLAMSPNLPPLVDRVPADKRAALLAAVKSTGLPIKYLDGLETWAVALSLSSAAIAKLGVEQDQGVEPKLTKIFENAGKPVAGLETVSEQLGYFDQLPEAAQRAFLLATIDEDDAKSRSEFDAMVAAWKAGDVRRIALTFDDEMKLTPALSDALIARRNAKWADWVARRMTTPGTVFMAVGAGHLAGTGSVEALLAAKGVRIKRLQ